MTGYLPSHKAVLLPSQLHRCANNAIYLKIPAKLSRKNASQPDTSSTNSKTKAIWSRTDNTFSLTTIRQATKGRKPATKSNPQQILGRPFAGVAHSSRSSRVRPEDCSTCSTYTARAVNFEGNSDYKAQALCQTRWSKSY